MIAQRARDNLAAVAFCALVGGQDELVFDGALVRRRPRGRGHRARAAVRRGAAGLRRRPAGRRRRAPARHAPAPRGARGARRGRAPRQRSRPARRAAEAPGARRRRWPSLLDADAEVYAALVLGTRDYVDKNGFEHVVLGLSGGIDSTLVALVAVDALGADRVTCVTMPSPLLVAGHAGRRPRARREPRRRAARAADRRGDGGLRRAAGATSFAGREPDITEENLQARIRGNLLDGAVEQVRLAGADDRQQVRDVGRLLDALRRQRRRLRGHQGRARSCSSTGSSPSARARDAASPVPETIVTRPPSAELRPDQRDEDSLPPYEVLDAILEGYVERGPRARAAHRARPARGGRRPRHPARRPRRVQAPPAAAGDQDHHARRSAATGAMPITNRYRGWLTESMQRMTAARQRLPSVGHVRPWRSCPPISRPCWTSSCAAGYT